MQWMFIIVMCFVLSVSMVAQAEEQQLTTSPKNHDLDGTHNFSGDNRFLVYDTRGAAGPGIENCQSIEKVAIETGEETVLYAAPKSIIDTRYAAPGMGAPYYSASKDVVAFIHGPLVESVTTRGYYAKNNRNGAEVVADGSGALTWLDYRDVATDRDTLPGAHRGGTHDHEYASNSNRLGITYDDALMPEYDRTIGYLEEHPNAPGDASHYFALLVKVVPKGTSVAGELEKAWGDNWVDEEGLQRAFIGKVRADNGIDYEQSLFVVDIPASVDITTADSGAFNRFPSPPEGLTVRRLTTSLANGIVRCHAPSKRIAYYGKAEDGTEQVFIIPADGAEDHADPAMRSVQATRFEQGVDGGVRWHPSGNAIACIVNNGIAVVDLIPGDSFGTATFLTPQNDTPERLSLVWSYDGKTLAYNKRIPSFDTEGNYLVTFDGLDFLQIFLVKQP